jgi:hypothetical protein
MKVVSLPIPSIILAAGPSGIGKTMVIKDLLPNLDNTFLLEKDSVVEDFLHSNPFNDPGRIDQKILFHSDQYRQWLRNQTYASMLRVAMTNAKLGKSTILDSCWIGWLKDYNGPYSLTRRIANFFDQKDLRNIRIPILYFYCQDSEIVKKRLVQRAKEDPKTYDRDWPKIKDNKSWQRQIEKEPTGLFGDLRNYRDIFYIDKSKDWSGNETKKQLKDILIFLSQKRTLGDSGLV